MPVVLSNGGVAWVHNLAHLRWQHMPPNSFIRYHNLLEAVVLQVALHVGHVDILAIPCLCMCLCTLGGSVTQSQEQPSSCTRSLMVSHFIGDGGGARKRKSQYDSRSYSLYGMATTS